MGDTPTTVCKRLERIAAIAMNTCARIGTEGIHAGNAVELLNLDKEIRGETDAIGKHLAAAIERFGSAPGSSADSNLSPLKLIGGGA